MHELLLLLYTVERVHANALDEHGLVLGRVDAGAHSLSRCRPLVVVAHTTHLEHELVDGAAATSLNTTPPL